MMFISCQILLVLLEAIRGVPDRLARVVRHSVDALCGDFGHEGVEVSSRLCRILHLSRVGGTLPHQSIELFMLVAPFHVRRSPQHLKLLVMALSRLHMHDAGRVLRVDTLFVLARLGDSTFRDT